MPVDVSTLGPGDLTALGALFDRWAGPVHRMVVCALPATATSGDVDRVVEEVFWRVWRAGRDTPIALVISDCVRGYRRRSRESP
jgi:hypothetical protein